MSKLSRDDVAKLAYLARLKLEPEELDHFTVELAKILDYVQMLDGADTTGLEPTSQVTGLQNVTRPDVITGGSSPEELLKNAAKVRDGQIEARRMIA